MSTKYFTHLKSILSQINVETYTIQMLKEISYWLEVELIFFVVFKAVHRNQSQLCYFVDYPESFYIVKLR